MRFLVVDDSLTTRRIVIESLRNLGHSDVLQAENGQKGMEHVASGTVEFIITDWNMPEMGGMEFVRAVRARDTLVPILMITSNVSAEDSLLATSAGANGYVVKPFTPETLRLKISALLAGRAEPPASAQG